MTTSRHDSFLNLWLKTENQESTRVHTSHKARPDCVKDGAEGGSAEQQQCCAVSSEKFGISIHRTRGWTHSVLQHSTSCLPASCWWPCPPCWERRSSSVLPETESPESSCTCRSERKMRMVEYGKWGKWKIGRHRCMDGGGGGCQIKQLMRSRNKIVSEKSYNFHLQKQTMSAFTCHTLLSGALQTRTRNSIHTHGIYRRTC